MASDPKGRNFSLTYQGGYLNTTIGLLEALYGADFEQKVGAGQAKTVNVKAHTRQRVIGGPVTNIAAHSFGMIDYPRRLSGGSMGGQSIRIESGGSWWTARLGGSVQDFKAFLAGTGKPTSAFQFITEKGGLYSSAS
jgi:hypothetical protein